MYLGSMFYLDFGKTFRSVTPKGKPIQVGQMTLSVREVEWCFYRFDRIACCAETVLPEEFDRIVSVLTGTTLSAVRYIPGDERADFCFSNEWVLGVDLTNRWGTDSDFVEVSLPNGRALYLTEKVSLKQGFDAVRAKNWHGAQH
jgi:hypothetical protein